MTGSNMVFLTLVPNGTLFLNLSYNNFYVGLHLNQQVTYLLTYWMVQSPSWAANWFAASQEIPRISRNPKVHYRTHKRPPPVPILGQPNPVHTPTSYFMKIRLNPLTAELNPTCRLLALLGAHHILHFSRIRTYIILPSTHECKVWDT